ncbi:hypothetical protein IFM89_020782 [Coptis chinensis]|uniref:Uncharacterized protein n=1 Tax=Coptis chinensis TaxID=261450 RepID=A0A835LRX6_9MAGN|nr:hypothetical protein IFM89_020782 [Coptis chinensis]
MDAISSSNVSQTKGTKKNQRRRGDDTEIIKIENAKLWFMGGQAHNRIVGVVKEGDFMIRLVMQSLSPALMTICVVQKTEWPLTKDYLVMRVGFRSFAFAMPGLLYGLQLTPNCYDEIFETLERIFMRFGYYKDLTGRQTKVAKMDFEVPIASEPVRGPPAFFVAMEIDLNTAPEMADVSPREIIFPILSQEANAMPREIRFPILDEVGSSWKVNKNNIVDQMGLAGVNLKLGYMN